MKKVILGDTIVFKTTALDQDGTALTGATVTLQVTDSSGSQVLNDTISHLSGGTYQETKSTAGWAIGPIRQNWTIEDSAGTMSKPVQNQVRIVNDGTATPTYVYEDELSQWYPSIVDYLDSYSEDHVVAAYKYTNRVLDNLGFATPVAKNDDGLYDQSVRDHNAWDAIYRIVKGNQIAQVQRDEDGRFWFDGFMEAREQTYKDWESKKITLQRKVSPSEGGISPSTRAVGTSAGTMLTNHDEAFGAGFSGKDYKRDWELTITGTGTSGGVRECTYKWNNDGGHGTLTGTTSDSWVELKDEVYVRFNRGTATGTTNLFEVNDKWTWTTTPVKYQQGGKNIARGY